MDFKDLDRLKANILNDVTSRIKKDSVNTANKVVSKVDDVIKAADANGKVNISRTDKGVIVKANIDCPTPNAVDLINGIDDAIKSTFRFGKWSDMKVD